jgi:hypothetical protein
MKFGIPKSEAETNTLISFAREVLPKLVDDELEEACKDLIVLAGSFNHNITYKHRDQIIDILSNIGMAAIRPILYALIDCPREEQVDITIAFIRTMI